MAIRRLTYELEQQHVAFLAWADDEGTIPETAAAAVGGPRALLVPRGVGLIAADDEHTRRLAETLFVVLEEQGSPRRAGRRLGLHENTVAKRMRTVDDVLDPGARPSTSDLLAALTIRLGHRPEPV